ncbi:MAG: helix-turn-helix domain-containing protein [Patescibacteria group bacterium]|nr:helix-turn-helix domain-containing protein [Patescibacteria group bacterium]
MGKIEDTIFENYKKAIEQGNIEQAEKALNLAKTLKDLIENHGFIDYTNANQTYPLPATRNFSSLLYKYDYHQACINTQNKQIILTPLENKLFYLFDQKTTDKYENNKILTKIEIKTALFRKTFSNSALRIAIHRLRLKLGDIPKNPNIIINFYKTGYIFMGKRLET